MPSNGVVVDDEFRLLLQNWLRKKRSSIMGLSKYCTYEGRTIGFLASGHIILVRSICRYGSTLRPNAQHAILAHFLDFFDPMVLRPAGIDEFHSVTIVST